jgi:hypothetical protein
VILKLKKLSSDRYRAKTLTPEQEAQKEFYYYCKDEKHLSKEILGVIATGFLKGLSLEQIKKIVRDDFNAKQMNFLLEAMLNKTNENKIDFLINGEFDEDSMLLVLNCLNAGMSTEEAQILKPLNNEQLLQVEMGYVTNKLDYEKIKIFANSRFSSQQMEIIRKAFSDFDLSIEEVKRFAKPEYDIDRMTLMRNGIAYHSEDFADFLSPNVYKANRIYKFIRKAFLK